MLDLLVTLVNQPLVALRLNVSKVSWLYPELYENSAFPHLYFVISSS